VSAVFAKGPSRPATGDQVARAAGRQPPRVVAARWSANASSTEVVLPGRLAAHLPPLTVRPPRPLPESRRGRPSPPPGPSASKLWMRCSACPPPTAKRLPGEGATEPTAAGRVAATAASSGWWRRRGRRGVRLTLPRLVCGGGGGGDGRLPASPPPPPGTGSVAADTVLLRAAAGHLTAANRRLRARLGAAREDERLQMLSAVASTPATAGGGGWAPATRVVRGATAVAAMRVRGRRPSGGQWHWRWRRAAGGAPHRRPRRSTRRWRHVCRAALRVRRGARVHHTSWPPPFVTSAASLTLTFEAAALQEKSVSESQVLRLKIPG